MSLPFNDIKSKIIYVAALLESEGWFGFYSGKYPRIRIEMTDLDIIQRARDIMNPSAKIHVTENKLEDFDYKTKYLFQLEGRKSVEWMMTLYVLMGNRRKERIRETLQVWKNHVVDEARRRERISEGHKTNKMVKLIMTSRKVSREEAEKILEDSLSPKNQTIN